MFKNKKALLLDMNSTFMFGEDRFGSDEDYSIYYQQIGGRYPADFVNDLINSTYDYLEERYPAEAYRHNFPSLQSAIEENVDEKLPCAELAKLIETFSHHEHGFIPREHISALHGLNQRFVLAAIIDIWSPKTIWIRTFEESGILPLFSAISFSSDHGMVKPSPRPFELVIDNIGIPKEECLMIGDSVRRDLGGALAAGIDCALVGGASDSRAKGCFSSLLDFYKTVQYSY